MACSVSQICVAVVVCSLLLARSAAGQSTATCSLKASDFSKVDFAAIGRECGTQTPPSSPADKNAYCEKCVCAMGTYFVLGLTDANVRINGESIPTLLASTTRNAVNDLLMSCSTLFAGQLLARANLSTAALASLTSCETTNAATQCEARIQEALKMPGKGDSTTAVTAASKSPPAADAATAAMPASPTAGGEAKTSGSTGARAVAGDLVMIATAVASLPLLMAFLSF